MKLKSKTIVPYKGEVVDLCVANSHTYNVEGVAVHNSGGGSLVAYVLYITDLDPLFWDLPFARFLSVYRKGAPDIDCVHCDHLVIMADGSHKRAGDIVSGDTVLGGDGLSHAVTATYSRGLRYLEDAVWVRVKADDGTLGHMLTVPGHKFVRDDGEVVYCRDLNVGDMLMATCPVEVVSIEHGGYFMPKLEEGNFWIVSIEHGGYGSSQGQYVDLTVEDDHRFHVIPFTVSVTTDGTVDHQIGYCTGTIPGTFIACGEAGNYCSDPCMNSASQVDRPT